MPAGETIADVGILLISAIRDEFMCAVSATIDEGVMFISRLSSCASKSCSATFLLNDS